ncbi:lantibiotic dehydratase family protein [Planotetraspora sp. A-T 1434]|uniref:lantibiotic dehydratase family protein n=1 Tax=Planotetraspora sp. A-T 1434 TaxID=2979219 RepID=UPI0021C162F7|nr:lantibiotic dehydratase family protein [Planotetraspora sp. A-T 1434]MCT9933313.1 lantibiotic dehydratase family protein [Planotetraspora sp. A-T 1434]
MYGDTGASSGKLISLPQNFGLWSQGVLRSAGFPIGQLLRLSDDAYVTAVGELLDAEEQGRDTGAARARLAEVARAAGERQNERLAAVARRADVLEAIAWQNPDVVESMIVPLGETGRDTPRNQRLRKRQRLLAKYWTRYCAKNETIGFFGPSVWFALRDEGEPLRLKPGPAVTGSRSVFLEPWAVDTLAQVMGRDPEIRPWVAPRPHHACHLAGDGVTLLTLGGPVTLEPLEAKVFALLDHTRSAREVAAALPYEEEEVFAALEGLVSRQLAFWDLECSLRQRAEVDLRERLGRIGDPRVRAAALGRLDRIEAAVSAVAECREPATLVTRMQELETVFTELTGVDPSRRPGQAYGGRRLLYLEATRDVEVSFGPQVLEAVAEPLGLLLTGFRWFAEEAARALRATLSDAFDALTTASGTAEGADVGFNELVFSVADQVFIPGNRPLDRLMAEFTRRWRDLLGMDTDAPEIAHTSEALGPLVRAAFPASAPSWTWGRIHSVDLHLAATDPEAFARGEFYAILGEAHSTYSPIECGAMSWSHPDPVERRRMFDTIIPRGRVMLSPVKDFPKVVARAYAGQGPDDWWLCVSQFPAPDTDRLLPLCGLRVRRVADGRLEAGVPGSERWFDVAEICGMWTVNEIVDLLKLVVRGHERTPRVTIDGLVLFRASRSFPVTDLEWTRGAGDQELFVAAHRWLRRTGLPRVLFAAISTEPKPVFADFGSEVQVANLAQLVRAAAETPGATVTFSEMSPAPGETWLADAEGELYTSELRLQFVDQLGTT